MAKAKYKIGTLVKTQKPEGGYDYAEITQVITSKEGYSYRTASNETHDEEQIMTSFREVTARQPRKGKAMKKTRTRAVAHESALAN